MKETLASVMSQVASLVAEYRVRCLWFLREDFVPQTPSEAFRALESIEKHGDADAFRKAAPLKRWLSQHSSAASAGS